MRSFLSSLLGIQNISRILGIFFSIHDLRIVFDAMIDRGL